MSQAQVQTSGYVEYQQRHESNEVQGDINMRNTTLRINAATYLWEPWIAVIDGGLGLTYNSLDTETGDQDGEIITGEGRLRLFPRSHFPFEVFAESRDSRVDGTLAGSDFSSTRYGFSQQYIPDVGTRVKLRYQNSEREELREFSNRPDDQNTSNQELVDLSLRRTIGKNSFDFDSHWEETLRDETGLDDKRILHLLRHRYRPDVSLSVDNVLSQTNTEITSSSSTTRNERSQLISTAFWRPRTQRPLTVTGTALFVESEQFINNSANDNSANSYVLSGGFNYQWTPSLSLRGTTSINQTETNTLEQNSTLVRVGATYNGDVVKLGSMDYRWSVLADVGNRTGVDDANGNSVQEYSFGINHGVSRITALNGGSLQFNLSQDATVLNTSNDFEEHILTHSASLGWTHRGPNTSTIMQISASDRRRVDGEKSIFQIINLQASRTRQLNRVSSWSGNLTVQATRTSTDIQDNDWQTIANIDLNYQHQRVFDIPRLRFISEYRFLSEQFNEFNNGINNDILEERDTHFWKNRLEYYIGRLELSLHANLTEREGVRDTLIMFMLRRNFGGMGPVAN